ncbi:hypothetical protein WA158_000548 [Blastocystis sp. Blastoise]
MLFFQKPSVAYVLGLGGTCSDGLKGSSMLFVSYGGCGVACYANCEGSSVVLNDANGSNDVIVGSSYCIEGSSVAVHVDSGVDDRCLCGVEGSSDAFNTAVDVVGDQIDCSYGIKGSFIVVCVVAEGPSILIESSIIGNERFFKSVMI